MDRLSAMELFVAAMEEGSLSGGARRLGRPAVAATRAVTMLERETGETLLLRSTRRIALTAAGEHWLGVWRDVLGLLVAADRDGPTFGGAFTVTAPSLFGRTHIQPLVEAFLLDRPTTEVRLLLLSRVVDLMEEGIDLAVRVGELAGNGVAATRLGQVRTLMCAAPAYLERRGAPAEPGALDRHDCIGVGDGRGEAWGIADPARGRVHSIVVPTRFSVNSAGAVLEATLRGSGIGRIMSCQAVEHLRAGRLVPVLARWAVPAVPVHFVFRGQPPRTGALRSFVDHAAPALRRDLAGIEAAIAAILADAAS